MNRIEDTPGDELMKELIAALETRPEVDVPADFATRLMQRVPHPSARRFVLSDRSNRERRYGKVALLAALLLLLAGMAVLAPLTLRSGIWLTLQMLLFAQFCVLLAVANRPWRTF